MWDVAWLGVKIKGMRNGSLRGSVWLMWYCRDWFPNRFINLGHGGVRSGICWPTVDKTRHVTTLLFVRSSKGFVDVDIKNRECPSPQRILPYISWQVIINGIAASLTKTISVRLYQRKGREWHVEFHVLALRIFRACARGSKNSDGPQSGRVQY